MKTRRLLTALFACTAVLVAACSSTSGDATKSLIQQVKDAGVLKLGVAAAPPFLYQDTADPTNWKGIFVDPMAELAKTMDVKLEFVPTNWDTMIAGLQSGKFDVAAALNARPARAIAVSFSEPLMQSKGVYLLDPSSVSARTWDQLNDSKYNICTAVGSAEDLALTNMKPNAQITRLKDDASCIQALLAGQVSAVKWDWTGAGQVIQANPQICMLAPNPPQNGEGIGYAIAFGWRYEDIAALNSEIDAFTQQQKLVKSMSDNGFIDPDPYNCGS